ncbi:MAG TPA: hypothetical protein ENH23_05785, partial [candidate division Zixibacteria bacterium]|nr:hypothetical protein [candidate division Zixibacteria bacterium]
MKNKIIILFVLLILFTTTSFTYAQVSQPNVITATSTTQSIQLDGDLTESDWQQATRISNFTQRELLEGQPGSERTEVAILYDK